MKLFFRQFGEGDPVVILHGLFGLSDNWVTIAKRLSGKFTVFLPELRNHGQSPHSPVFTVEAMVEDLAEFLEVNRVDSPHLIGHSLGGIVAMFFAMNYPETLRKLVVVDISLRQKRNFSEHQSLIETMKGVDLATASSRIDVERSLAVRIPSVSLRQFLLKNVYWRDRDHLDWRLNLDVLSNSLPLEIPGHGNLGKFKGETLIIRGENSDYVTDADMIEIVESFPRTILRTIPGAGHWVHADAPEEFIAVVSGFLK